MNNCNEVLFASETIEMRANVCRMDGMPSAVGEREGRERVLDHTTGEFKGITGWFDNLLPSP
jgi:hypothetical protein